MNNYIIWSRLLNDKFKEKAKELCGLDALAGDGDHGLTISRGFSEAWKNVSQMPDDSLPSEICRQIGYSMLRSMGGASGPIFSTFFIQMAIKLKAAEELTAENIEDVFVETLNSVLDLTDSQLGDKTMADAVYGAIQMLRSNKYSTLQEALNLAVDGALAGSDSTKDMIAKKGRARFLGERSRGFIDAGSRSVVYIMQTMAQAFSDEEEQKYE